MSTSGPVIVMQLPQQLGDTEVNAFMDDFRPLLKVDRSRHVLDCSQVQHFGAAGIEMLLACMNEAITHSGDVKLASVSVAMKGTLELSRIDRLFEVFDTASEAVRSFETHPLREAPQTEPWYSSAKAALGDLKIAG